MVKIGRAAPMFGVTNLEKSIKFWTAALGFEQTFSNGDPVCFVILKRGDSEIHLKQDAKRAGHGHCHILVEGLEDIHRAFEPNGGKIVQVPKVQSWGMKDIVFADPDGNTIEMAERLTKEV